MRSNVSIYWVGATALAVWFLFWHSPQALRHQTVDVLFAIHLAGAYMLYLACVHNTIITPSTMAGQGRRLHVWVGRVGLVAGLVSFVVGAYLTWTRIAWNDPGFSVGITVGGVLQVYAEVRGYMAIKRHQHLRQNRTPRPADEHPDGVALSIDFPRGANPEQAALLAAKKEHVICMVSLFVAACGIPAAIRLFPQRLGMVVLGIVALNVWCDAYVRHWKRKLDNENEAALQNLITRFVS